LLFWKLPTIIQFLGRNDMRRRRDDDAAEYGEKMPKIGSILRRPPRASAATRATPFRLCEIGAGLRGGWAIKGAATH